MIHATLIVLAEIKPINEEDDVTLEAIPKQKQIVFSTGLQYNIHSILDYLKRGEQPAATLSEAISNRIVGPRLRVPTHNGEIHPLDIAHFKMTLRQMNIPLPRFQKQSLFSYALGEAGSYIWNSFFHSYEDIHTQISTVLQTLNSSSTVEEFRSIWKRKRLRDDFSPAHASALIALVQNHALTLEQAIAEINGLSKAEVTALQQLYHNGVRGQQLREWDNTNEVEFTDMHGKTLVFLMCEKNLSFEEAFLELDQVDSWSIGALYSCYDLGLRGKHFGLISSWSTFHERLFRVLVTTENLSVEDAIQECATLSRAGATVALTLLPYGINRKDILNEPEIATHMANMLQEDNRNDYRSYEASLGDYLRLFKSKYQMDYFAITREIMGLNKWQRHILAIFYDDGLRGEYLRSNFPHGFTKLHEEVVFYLVRKKHLSPQEACSKLVGKSEKELESFRQWFDGYEIGITGLLGAALFLAAIPQTIAGALMAITVFTTMKVSSPPSLDKVEEDDHALKAESTMVMPMQK